MRTASDMGHSGPVASAEFNADGTQVITASDDGTALFSCDVCRPLPELLELAAGRVTRSLTPAERARLF